ncbi:hypothetical protein KFE25_007327 [Diacronema lutheri]|uniref:DUF1995 domain-containing protein n=3 Tax=Diacronema lutheri TaxID=2081491 RepID=A0A8J5XR19_DIALT|nr:hypothetical protein KFE25_007327 [Diacronema lutheri]
MRADVLVLGALVAAAARPADGALVARAWRSVRAAAPARARPSGAAVRGAADGDAPAARGPSALALEQTAAFLNAEVPELVIELARAYTPAGEAERRANVWSRGSYVLESARVTGVSASGGLNIESAVSRRGRAGVELEAGAVPWLGGGAACDEDGLVRELLRLANALGRARDGAALLRLPIGSGRWSLPDNWRLNATPHPAGVRNRFYSEVFDALSAALRAPDCPSRLRVTTLFPELNQAMDVYRGATLLEMIREVSLRLATGGPARAAADGDGDGDGGAARVRPLNVRICVQASMGQGVFTGLPLAISGLRKTMEVMDWQAEEGGRFEGILGTSGEADGRPAGDRFVGSDAERSAAPPTPAGARGRVRFGAVERDVVQPGDDLVFVLAPQSMQGVCIVGPLQRLVADAEAVGAKVCLVNPALRDIPSAAGVMQVKGRAERIAFAASFADVYTFRCLFFAGRFAFPIVGALRYSLADAPFWTVYRRLEGEDRTGVPGVSERYEPVAAYAAAPSGGGGGVAADARLVAPLLCAPPPSEETTELLGRGQGGAAAARAR